MQIMKRMLIGTGVVALAVILITVLSPRSAHALVATLVQIANTTANPAITADADKLTRIPYQSVAQFNGGPGLASGFATFATVPAGYRLTIERINAGLNLGSANPAPIAYIYSAFNSTGFFPTVTGTFVGANGSQLAGTLYNGGINQEVTRYIGAGDTPQVLIRADFGSGLQFNLPGLNTVMLTGYLEDCSITGCPLKE